MADFEVHIYLDGGTRPVGLAQCDRARGSETILFEYASEWLGDPNRFSLKPALPLTSGPYAPPGAFPFSDRSATRPPTTGDGD